MFYVHVLPPPRAALLVADALGLALFAMSGAQIAEAAKLSPFIVVLMGTMTGVTGGIFRDVREIYAAAAIAGVSLYLLLQALGMERLWAFGGGMAVVVALRLLFILWGWQLPVFRLRHEPR